MKLTFVLTQVLLISVNINFPAINFIKRSVYFRNLNYHYFGSEFSIHF